MLPGNPKVTKPIVGVAVLVVITLVGIAVMQGGQKNKRATLQSVDTSNGQTATDTTSTGGGASGGSNAPVAAATPTPATATTSAPTPTKSTAASTTVAPTAAATPKSTPTPTPSFTYRNGTFSAVGHYSSPAGTEAITISITIASDKITATSAINGATNHESQQYENDFIAHYQPSVIGKSVATLSLGKISTASLTPRGFNDALAQIRIQAHN